MKRSWVAIALLLSLGMNVGIVAILLLHRVKQREVVTPSAELVTGPGVPMDLAERMADRLRLDGEKRERFVAIQDGFLQRAVRGRRELEALRRELRGEMVAARPDRERSLDLVTRSAALQSELERAFVQSILDTRDLLGPIEDRLYLQMLARLRPLVLGGAGGQAGEARPPLLERRLRGALDAGVAAGSEDGRLATPLDGPADEPRRGAVDDGGVRDRRPDAEVPGRPFPGARSERLAPGPEARRERVEMLRERFEARRERRDAPPRWPPRAGPPGRPVGPTPPGADRPVEPPTPVEPRPAPEADDPPPP